MLNLLSESGIRNPVALLIPLLATLTVSCSSATEPPADSSYSGEFDPPLLALATHDCDRFLTGATLLLADTEPMSNLDFGDGDFDRTVNLTEDCSRSGGEVSSLKDVISGEYVISDTTVLFGSPSITSFPDFRATFDAEFLRLDLPSDDAWPELTSATLELGPRQPL